VPPPRAQPFVKVGWGGGTSTPLLTSTTTEFFAMKVRYECRRICDKFRTKNNYMSM